MKRKRVNSSIFLKEEEFGSCCSYKWYETLFEFTKMNFEPKFKICLFGKSGKLINFKN